MNIKIWTSLATAFSPDIEVPDPHLVKVICGGAEYWLKDTPEGLTISIGGRLEIFPCASNMIRIRERKEDG